MMQRTQPGKISLLSPPPQYHHTGLHPLLPVTRPKSGDKARAWVEIFWAYQYGIKRDGVKGSAGLSPEVLNVPISTLPHS